ncbi:hypothetical protein ACOV11_24380, partial [Vibrio natriegens]
NSSIWVEGSCEISGKNYENIVKKSNAMDGTMILVHDGMFSLFPNKVLNDKNESLNYQGIIFHYNLDYKFNFNDWEGSKAKDYLKIPSVFGENIYMASFYLHGALNMEGAFILDAKHYDHDLEKFKSQNSLLNDSFAM